MRIEREEVTIVKDFFVTSTGEKFENSFDALRAEADFLAKEGRLKTFDTWNEPETVKDCEIVFVADEEAREVFEEFSDALGVDGKLREEALGWFFYHNGAWHTCRETITMIAEEYQQQIKDCEYNWRKEFKNG
jgi:hypothetical protein